MTQQKRIAAPLWLLLLNILLSCAFSQSFDNWQLKRADGSETNDLTASRRSLQTRKTVCNTVLASWTAQEVSTNFFNSLGNNPVKPLLQFALQSKFKYGVQIRTMCASCRQVMARLNSSVAASLNDICGLKAYGENVAVSGLVMYPLQPNTMRLAAGTMKGVIYCHGTSTDTWPSTDFQGSQTSAEILQFTALTSLGGSVAIIPDYMGFGSSLGSLYKAYTILKSYQTSFIPLWYQAQYTLAQSTNCSSVLSNQAAVVGYSEGGYASVAVAQALVKAGVKVLHVDSGGAPFRVASTAILSIIQGVENGTFPLDERYIFGVIGSAYSGTYPLSNSNQTSQYLLKPRSRNAIVSLVTNSSSTASLYAQIPINNPLSIFTRQYVAFARQVIASKNPNPCHNNNTRFLQTMGSLCNALVLNDLTNYLETQVNYPIRLCHSTQDALVSYANLPNISRNSKYLSLISGVTGSHQDASLYCVAQAFLYLISPDFQNIAIPNQASAHGCPK